MRQQKTSTSAANATETTATTDATNKSTETANVAVVDVSDFTQLATAVRKLEIVQEEISDLDAAASNDESPKPQGAKMLLSLLQSVLIKRSQLQMHLKFADLPFAFRMLAQVAEGFQKERRGSIVTTIESMDDGVQKGDPDSRLVLRLDRIKLPKLNDN
eukprot:gene14174-20141_t